MYILPTLSWKLIGISGPLELKRAPDRFLAALSTASESRVAAKLSLSEGMAAKLAEWGRADDLPVSDQAHPEKRLIRPVVTFNLEVRFQGIVEAWYLDLFFTQFPHLRCRFSSGNKDSQLIRDKGFVDALLASRCADIVALESDRVRRGSAPGLYLLHKLQQIRSLEWLFNTAYDPRDWGLRPFEESISAALLQEKKLSGVVDLRQDAKSVSAFLSECDELILRILGRDRFATQLAPLSISLEQWFAKPSRIHFWSRPH